MPETRGLSYEELEKLGFTISENKKGQPRVDFNRPPAGKVFAPIPLDEDGIKGGVLNPRFVTRWWFGGTRLRVVMVLMDEGDTWRVRRFVKGIKSDCQKQERKNRCWIISPKTRNKIKCPEENRCRKDNCPKKQGLWTGHSQFKQRINKGERDKFVVEGDHPALIDRESFIRANDMITKHARDYRNTPEDSLERKNRYIFSGKVCCGVCGSVMYREGNAYYRCRSQENYDFFDVAFTDDNNQSEGNETMQHEKDQLSQELDQVFHRIVAGHVDADLLARKRLLESQLARLSGQAAKSSQESIAIQELKRFVIQRGIQESFTTEDEEAFTHFIEKVVAYPGMRCAFHYKCGLVLTETADRNAYREAGLLQELDAVG